MACLADDRSRGAGRKAGAGLRAGRGAATRGRAQRDPLLRERDLLLREMVPPDRIELSTSALPKQFTALAVAMLRGDRCLTASLAPSTQRLLEPRSHTAWTPNGLPRLWRDDRKRWREVTGHPCTHSLLPHIRTTAENRMITFSDFFAESFPLAVGKITSSQSSLTNYARLGSGPELRSREVGRSSDAAARSRAPLLR